MGDAEGGGAGGGGAGGDRFSSTHHLVSMQRNRNHDSPFKFKDKKIVLTKKFKVDNEAANLANQALVDTYNAMWDAGVAFEDVSYCPHGKKDGTKEQRRELIKSFKDLLDKVKLQKAAVDQFGVRAVPFPGKVQSALPQLFQDIMKENED